MKMKVATVLVLIIVLGGLEMPWNNCDSKSVFDCLTRKCKNCKILQLRDETSPLIQCTKPNNQWVENP